MAAAAGVAETETRRCVLGLRRGWTGGSYPARRDRAAPPPTPLRTDGFNRPPHPRLGRTSECAGKVYSEQRQAFLVRGS